MFVEGLATMMPTTSRVESDFSLMSYRRNSYCAGLTGCDVCEAVQGSPAGCGASIVCIIQSFVWCPIF